MPLGGPSAQEGRGGEYIECLPSAWHEGTLCYNVLMTAGKWDLLASFSRGAN